MHEVYHDDDTELAEAPVCQALCIDDNKPLDEDDEKLLIRAWEARHSLSVARIVRQVTQKNTKSKEVEWYVMDKYTDFHMRWPWKIFRKMVGL